MTKLCMNKFSKQCFQMIVRSCVVFCTNTHTYAQIYAHQLYTIYFKMIFLDSCLVFCEWCGQFEGLASCVESPLTSSSPSNTYKILQLFLRTSMYHELVSQAQRSSISSNSLFTVRNSYHERQSKTL